MSWLRRSKPLCFLFLAIRVVDGKDLRATIQFAQTAARILDDVGLIAFGPSADGAGYASLSVPPEVELDRVLARVATALRSAKA